jgi:L-asparagine oxygenase
VLVKGLPVDEELPVTPQTGGPLPPDYKTTFVSEAMLLALGELTGAEPFNFRQEGQGKAPLIDNIVPVYKLKAQKGAGGFDNNFPFHCESAWHRKRPDYLILLGVRAAEDAQTLVFSTRMFDGTPWQTASADIRQWFRLKAPDLYVQMEKAGIPMGTADFALKPPIEYGPDGIQLHINFNGTDCIDMNAVEWLAGLEDFIESKTVGTIISSGDALLLNNYLTCHTRTGYSPVFNGMDRWFLRGYFKKDLWARNEKAAEEIYDEQAFRELVALGWMSQDGTLTASFSKFVHQPEEVKKLEDREAALAALAFRLTPIAGTRLV